MEDLSVFELRNWLGLVVSNFLLLVLLLQDWVSKVKSGV